MSGININSEALCRKAYLNYHCYENSMGLSARDMAQITQKWEDRINSWKNSVSSDENEYDFDDSDYSAYKEQGKDTAKDATGYSGNDAGNIVNGSVSAVAGVGGATWTAIDGGVKAAKNVKGFKSFSPKGNNKVSGSSYVQAALAIATAIAYRIEKPNKTEKAACDEMANELANAQGTLAETQGEMETMSEELITLSDEANEMNEAANEEMKEDGTEFNMYKTSLEMLQAKIESGQPLTKEEQAFYKELVKILGEIGVNIAETSEENTDAVEEIYGDMETYQEGYDYAAETMGEVEGMTEYTAGFDEATRTMCWVQGFGQAGNAVSGFMAGAKLMCSGWWNWGLGIASIAAGGSSVAASAEQFKMVKGLNNDIDVRKATEELNAATNEMYTEEIDAYDGFMTGVEDLEMEVPEEIEAPEAMTVPAGGGGEGTGGAGATGSTGGATTGGSTGGTGGADDPKKKPEE